jgi:Ca2+-binding RTX toxin-like protein
MTLSAEEQYMLELINRARLDPDAEAQRQGIGLNDGLAADAISSTAKEVLAPNALLETAATDHTNWLVANSTFTHRGAGDSLPDDRISATGYPGGSGFNYGEILGVVDASGFGSMTEMINELHRLTMLNAVDSASGSSDREALFYDSVREAGIEIWTGSYTIASSSWALAHVPLGEVFNATVTTQNFGRVGTDVFLTGVAYSDADHDGFYSIGEGLAGVGFAIGANATATAAAGGYALQLAPGAGVGVTVTAAGGAVSEVLADLSAGNVKLDLVDGTLLRSSGNLTLVSGVAAAELLGIADLTLAGNALANRLTGNRGDNVLTGLDGSDLLSGGIGNDTIGGGDNYDTIRGGDGDDQAWGGNGRDLIFLGTGNDIFWDNGQNDANGHDTVYGGAGNDTVNGGGGNELIYGEAGADSLLGGIGNDTISAGDNYDTVRGGDGNDQVWGGNGRDLIFLGTGNDIFWDNGQNDANGHDTVYGGAGNDTVNGGGGNELIQGEDGADSLLGGIGNDTLWGGADADRFVFLAGCGGDRVADFEDGIDTLVLDDALWGGGLSVAQVIAAYVSVIASDTVFDFGGGNTVTLAGWALPASLGDDIAFI